MTLLSCILERRQGPPDDSQVRQIAQNGLTDTEGPLGSLTKLQCLALFGGVHSFPEWPAILGHIIRSQDS